MANIGTFTTTKHCSIGLNKTLVHSINARFERVENSSENGWQFRVFSGSVD
ncbi:hypothetical protein [Roseibium aggregatum]|uniref:Uncharacterized protein n=1 Tax=Roseibium aggregatum TaxID=187304 RepID=A0A926NVF6_9HYPH|nr:hypothetical protein [Roseibium aggregatum]MBD1544845.1 hypothetical protein [Roseibium aggregatum]